MKRRLLDRVGDTDNEPTNAAKKNKLGFNFAKEPVFSDEVCLSDIARAAERHTCCIMAY